MKLAICVPPEISDCYGHLSRYAERLAEVGAERGMQTETLYYTDPAFLAKLFTYLMDEDAIVHFYCYLYDLKITSHMVTPNVRHALDLSRARCIASICDHPFSDFMQEMIGNAHPKTRFMVIDRTFADEMRFMNPELSKAKFNHVPFVAPVSYDETRRVNFEEREFDFVLPLLIVDPSNFNFDSLVKKIPGTWLEKTLQGTYESALDDISRNPFHIFESCLKDEVGASMADLRRELPHAIPAVLKLLSSVDGMVRQERRGRMVSALLNDVGDLKIAVLNEPAPSLNIDPKVHHIGNRNAEETASLMANSRAVLNCSPTYPTNVHERVTVGMLYESCVITDLNPCIEQHFSDDEIVPYAPDTKMTINDIFKDYDMPAIAERAARKAQETPEFSWDSHLDAVLETAMI